MTEDVAVPPRLAVLDDYQRISRQMADWSTLDGLCAIEVFDRPLASIDEAVAALTPFRMISLMRERMPVPRALLERLPNLELLVLTGTRSPSLDLEAATDHGIIVSHTGGGPSQHATPELAWGLILSAARHLAAEDRNIRAGGWQSTLGLTLHGRTLGVLGLGKLGSRVAEIGRAFGMNVIAWSPNLTVERAAAGGARRVDKDELFAESDVLSIHMVLSDRSRGLVGARELGLMRPDAILVNTSRGPIIDEAALIETLRADRIGCAALDVYDREPLSVDHPLRGLSNTVLSPHLGYVTRETYRVFFTDTVEAVRGFLAGAPVRVMNPEVLKRGTRQSR
ncbi:MAG TPA: D-2-hydroxyacid dehydrogenase family protein [Stellaceae bacterium]|nr:D-2-hydroxyacid dehydrogenase family protein [Stellaceae bacterium]